MPIPTNSDPGPAKGPIGTAPWELRLLGDVELRGPGRRHEKLAGRALIALLARLALWPDRAHPREELIDLLWPDASLEAGRNRLRHTLSVLRGTLEPPGPARTPVLLADRQAIRLVPGAVDCDVVAFEARIRAGDGAGAVALYRGELLPGCYDEWIDDERRRLAALHERLVVPESTAAGPPRPGPGAGDDRIPLRLPAYLTPVFGLVDEAAALAERLRAQRLVTLLGPGGSGKTRLAVEVAHALQRTEAGAAFNLIAFVPLADCTTREAALEAIVAALRLDPPADGRSWLAIERALLGRRALLVLDNYEQLVDSGGALPVQLGSALPRLHLLVTSRRALGLDGEQLVDLPPLPLPSPEASVEEAARNPALALFVDRARAARATFRLGKGNVQVLGELVAELQGMPLAIELAATRVRAFPPADLLARLRASRLSAAPVAARLDLLARPGAHAGFDARHASMRNVIDWSWRQLPSAGAALLAALSVFRGGFTAAAAAAVFGDPASDIPLMLDELLAHSLLRRRDDDAAGASRFELDEPIREFAALQATNAAASRRRHRDWALDWARNLPATPPLETVRRELPNLHAAWSSALEDRCPDVGVALLLALEPAWYHVDPPASVLAVAIACVRDPGTRPEGRGPALSLLALLLQGAGEAEPALACAEEGLAAAAGTGEPSVRALYALARVRWRHLHQADPVRPLLDQAEQLADRLGLADPMLRARIHSLRASIASRADRDHGAAEALHLRALEASRRSGNRHAVNAARYALAVSAQNAGRHALALQRLDEVMEQAAALHDRRILAQALNVRGNALCGLRRWADAVQAFRESARVAWQTLAFYELAFVFWNLPRALAHLHAPQDAVRLAGFAERHWLETGGVLTPSDRRDQRRIRRLAACQLGRESIADLWVEGGGWTVRRALQVVLSTAAGEPDGAGLAIRQAFAVSSSLVAAEELSDRRAGARASVSAPGSEGTLRRDA